MTARCGHGRLWLWWPKVLHSRMIHHHRALLSSSTGRQSGDKTWQRTAVQVKNTDFNNNPYIDAIRRTHDPVQHVKTIEEELKGTIGRALGKQGEKVLRAVRSMQQEYREYERLTSLLLLQQRAEPQEEEDGATTTKEMSSNNETNHVVVEALHKTVQKYNHYRDQAVTARWELTVHRQAAGCIVGNHQYVQNAYPIGAKLVVPPNLLLNRLGRRGRCGGADGTGDNNVQTTTTTTTTPQLQHGGEMKKKKFTDQLDWWQNIGRWK
jgi:hypothetical protein